MASVVTTTSTETPTGDTIKVEVAAAAVPASVSSKPLSSRHIYKEVSRILLWREPVESGLIFGIINFTVYLLTCGGYSLITLSSYTLLSVLLVGGAYVYGSQLKARFSGGNFQNPLIARFKNSNLKISKDNFDEIIEIIVESVNLCEDKFRAAFLHTDPIETLKFAGIVFAASIVGKYISIVTIFVIVVWFAFVWPKVYELYHKEIHHYHGIAKGHVNQHLEKVLASIPPVGPLAQLVNKKKSE